MKKITVILYILFLMISCYAPPKAEYEGNSVYFWKTVFDTDSIENQFINDFNIKKIYIRYFDVITDKKTNRPKPNATIRFKTIPQKDLEVIPTVFITEDCLKKRMDTLYKTLADRILQINETHNIGQVNEIQIDCDYTAKSLENYYTFLTLLKNYLNQKSIKLSVTIRLHQLSMKVPPCDYGVLMLYNTGNYKDKKCENPIIGLKEIKPYLKNLKKYNLKLAAAFPNFKWQILFKKGVYNNILYGQNLSDSTLFREIDEKTFVVIRSKDIPVYLNNENFNVMMNYGDTIYLKKAEAKEILNVEKEIAELRKDILKHKIIYDLNALNINNLKHNEYEKIFNFGNNYNAD